MNVPASAEGSGAGGHIHAALLVGHKGKSWRPSQLDLVAHWDHFCRQAAPVTMRTRRRTSDPAAVARVATAARRHGVYRALLATRLACAVAQGATMALLTLLLSEVIQVTARAPLATIGTGTDWDVDLGGASGAPFRGFPG